MDEPTSELRSFADQSQAPFSRNCPMATGWFTVALIAGAVALVGGMTGVIYWGAGFDDTRGRWMMTVCSTWVAISGAYFILGAMKYRVILEPDAISLVGIFGVRRLRRDHIIGKLHFYRYVKYVVLYPHPFTQEKKIMIAYIYRRITEIDNWVSDIPDVGKNHHPWRPPGPI